MIRTYPDVSKGRTPTVRPLGFDDWLTKARKAKNPDEARSLLYYGFQPLFDALVENRTQAETREVTLDLLSAVTEFNQRLVSGYYTGDPLPDVAELEILAASIQAIDKRISYRIKERNIGLYDGDGRDLCTPSHVQQFLCAVEESDLPKPGYIVGCACGSSEIVMPMATLFKTPLGFIRRSKRRGDLSPLTITEQVPTLKRRSKNNVVWVVEDFVCTGQSIHSVMAQVQTYKPERVIGLSMARNMADSLTSKLKIIHTLPGKHGAYAYESK